MHNMVQISFNIHVGARIQHSEKSRCPQLAQLNYSYYCIQLLQVVRSREFLVSNNTLYACKHRHINSYKLLQKSSISEYLRHCTFLPLKKDRRNAYKLHN